MKASEKQKKLWAEIVSRAWKDKDFKAKLLANPEKVLKEYGCDIAQGTKLKVVEAREGEHYLLIPPMPKRGQLSEEELQNVVGAGCYGPWHS